MPLIPLMSIAAAQHRHSCLGELHNQRTNLGQIGGKIENKYKTQEKFEEMFMLQLVK